MEQPLEKASTFPIHSLESLGQALAKTRWVVPVLPNEQLQILLKATLEAVKEGKDQNDGHCQKFLNECIPLCFMRLMNDEAVKEWTQDVQRHILDCCIYLVQICALKCETCELDLLDTLSFLFNPRTRYHVHNCMKSHIIELDCNKNINSSSTVIENNVTDPVECENENLVVYAEPSITCGPPKGWLIALINKFGEYGGFENVSKRLSTSKLSCSLIYHSLRPFGLCYQYLKPDIIEKYLIPIIELCCKYMQSISDEEVIKETKSSTNDGAKETTNILVEITRFMRNLTIRAPGHENVVRDLERLRLKMILKTLKLSSFSAKMNALNEISRLLSSSSNMGFYNTSSSSLANNLHHSPSFSSPNIEETNLILTTSEILNWMRENQFLSICMKENLHLWQYVEKLERVLRYMIKENALTDRDLDDIWDSAQSDTKHEAIVKNIYELLAKLAWDFNADQLDHLFSCFRNSWHTTPNKQREKLLELIRKLAEDDKEGRLADKVLNLLWTFAHDDKITLDVLEQVLQCHAKILDYNSSINSHDRHIVKKNWLEKCVSEMANENASKRSWILPAMRHFRDICRQYSEEPPGYRTNFPGWSTDSFYRHRAITEMENSFHLLAIITDNLMLYMDAMRISIENEKSPSSVDNADFSADGFYTHREHVKRRLSFLKFILTDGRIYLQKTEAEKVWECLIEHPIFPEVDRMLGFKWFAKLMNEIENDLEQGARREFFETKVLHVEPKLLDEAGMLCFERFYKSVNCDAKHLEIVDTHNHRLMNQQQQQQQRITPQISYATWINTFDTIGVSYLWKVVMTASDLVAERAVDLIHDVYGNPGPHLMNDLRQFHSDFIQECLHRLKVSFETLSLLVSGKEKRHQASGDEEKICAEIVQHLTRSARVLRVLLGYVAVYDDRAASTIGNAALEQQRLPLRLCGVGRTMSIDVRLTSAAVGYRKPDTSSLRENMLTLLTHSNQTLGELKRRIAADLHVRPSSTFAPPPAQPGRRRRGSSWPPFFYLQLFHGELPLDQCGDDRKTLDEMQIGSGASIIAKIAQAFTLRSRSSSRGSDDRSPADDSNKSDSQDEVELQKDNNPAAADNNTATPSSKINNKPNGEEKDHSAQPQNCLPSLLLSDDLETMRFLLHLADLASKLASNNYRNFDMNTGCNNDEFGAVAHAAKILSAHCRQLLRDIPCCPTLIDRLRQTAQLAACSLNNTAFVALQNLFFCDSPNETLYNLELTYGQLAAPQLDAANMGEQSALPNFDRQAHFEFQTAFFAAGGLRLCFSMLVQNNFLQQSHDCSLKLAAFHNILRILKVMLGVAGYTRVSDFQQSQSIINRNSTGLTPTTATPTPKTNDEMVFLVQVICAVGATDVLRRNICKHWVSRLKNSPYASALNSCQPEIAELQRILRIAWASSSGNFALFFANDEKIRAQCLQVDEEDLTKEMIVVCCEALETASLCFALSFDLVSQITKDKTFQFCFVDMLFSPNELIRQTIVEQFYLLVTKAYKYDAKFLHFFLTLCFTELHSSKIIEQYSRSARDFFFFLRNLLQFAHLQGHALKNAQNLLIREIDWLEKARAHVIENGESFADETLLEGHLMVARELVEFLPPAFKYEFGSKGDGPSLIKVLLEDFLLPSSKSYVTQNRNFPLNHRGLERKIHRSTTLDENLTRKSPSFVPRSATATLCSLTRCVPVCGTNQSISAAYDLVISLCTNCVPNIQTAVSCINEMFYNDCNSSKTLTTVSEWEYSPSVNLRNNNPFVGLKNGGATCYMNSVLQQLFTIESLREAILNMDPDGKELKIDCASDDDDHQHLKKNEDANQANNISTNSANDSAHEKRDKYNLGILKCVQTIFAHLTASQLQYYIPRHFWRHFRFVENELINIREQHDALEFFNKLVDAVDEAWKTLTGEKREICSSIFGGTFADQKICKGCPHRYSREEPFNTLSVDVRHHSNLTDSLQEYVKGDLLESDNAYFCEKCNKKVDAVKRLCIKKLPPVLAIQLKRFDFDWEREIAVKFHDYFQFPRDLDMEPYTVDGLKKIEGDSIDDNPTESGNEDLSTKYKLRGVVIHSGQANGGHYYSCILHTFPNGKSKWYKFDDTDVSECPLEDDEEMRGQCFGGEYTSESFDNYYKRIQKRVTKRWWNAYLLFYERVAPSGILSLNDRDSGVSSVSPSDLSASMGSLDLNQNSRALKRMPSRLEEIVRRKNTKSIHERNQYTPEFFAFVRHFCLSSLSLLRNTDHNARLNQAGEQSLYLITQLASNFLFSTGFRAKRTLHGAPVGDWTDVFEICFKLSSQCRLWFAQEVYKSLSRISDYLFDAPNSEVRISFARILMSLAQWSHFDSTNAIKTITGLNLAHNVHDNISDLILETIISYLRDDNQKFQSQHYSSDSRFPYLKECLLGLYNYANIGPLERQQLSKLGLSQVVLQLEHDFLKCRSSGSFYAQEFNRFQNLLTGLIRLMQPPMVPVVSSATSPLNRTTIDSSGSVATAAIEVANESCSSSSGDQTLVEEDDRCELMARDADCSSAGSGSVSPVAAEASTSPRRLDDDSAEGGDDEEEEEDLGADADAEKIPTSKLLFRCQMPPPPPSSSPQPPCSSPVDDSPKSDRPLS